MRVSRGFLHSHSYTGNALACRAALATLDIFAEDQVIETIAPRGASRQLPAAAGRSPAGRHLRQRGMIAAFDVLSDDSRSSPSASTAQALAREILLRPIGNTVYFMPPYVISHEECEFLVARAIAALDAALHS
jgi:adenosylmethionine-8-amino-7-oxononanoate aminotransferase